MPPRLNKRQQRELEELEALGGPSHEAVGSGDEELAKPSLQTRTGLGFAAFFSPEEDDDESANEAPLRAHKPRKSKKKKKKKTVELPVSETPVVVESLPRSPPITAQVPSQTKVNKKAIKKAKSREKKATNDELDQALAELSVKYPELQNISSTTPSASGSKSSAQSLAILLSVSLPHLDSEAEMRKFFGSKVVQANRSTSSGPLGPSSRRQAGTLRSHLTRPQSSWWAAKQREGLSIRVLTEEELQDKVKRQMWDCVDEEKWWTVEYSKKYKSMTMSFMQTVMSGDPDGFWNLLGKLPWHADTLLQLSEVFRHREEYGQAVDFVDRALFTYERSFIGAFTFTSGLNRLDFDHVENRPFFLAIHRQLTDLQRRGCVRTAFEFARLLYSLDPWNDPHGALFHLDFLAFKAGMTQWLLDLFDLFTARRDKPGKGHDSRIDPSVLPGWLYTRALALRINEDAQRNQSHEGSTAALIEAITSFPSVVPLLADKLDVSLTVTIRSHRDFKIETDASFMSTSAAALHLLSHLYVLRSFSLWKDPAHSAWFASTVMAEFSSLPSALPTTARCSQFLSIYLQPSPRHSVYRHIMVLESSYRNLFSFIPRTILNAKSLACDPLPPPTSVTEYNQEFFKGTDDMFSIRSRTRQERAADERRLERLIPDAPFRQQLQAFFEAHPNFANRFPGGILQFAQMAGQLPEDVLEDVMLVEAMAGEGAQNQRHGMPGQMPGFVDFTDEEGDDPADRELGQDNLVLPGPDGRDENTEGEDVDDDEDDDEDDDVPPMPVRVLRNLLGRFWGRNAVVEDSSEDDTAIMPVDDAGVD